MLILISNREQREGRWRRKRTGTAWWSSNQCRRWESLTELPEQVRSQNRQPLSFIILEICFYFRSGKKVRNLSDMIMEKIAEKQSDLHTKLTDDGSMKIEDLDPRIREMYEGVRDVMKRYRSGKVPKAFKIIPKLKNWEHILYITEPFNWTAAAMFQGTR